MSKVCEICKKEYRVKPSRDNKTKYCSQGCQLNAYTKIIKEKSAQLKIKKNCEVCKVDFNVIASLDDAKFCSQKCFGLSKKGFIPWNKGKKDVYSPETREQMGRDKLGRASWNKGIPMTEEVKEKCRTANSGEKCHFWKGGVSNQSGYLSFMYRRRKIRKEGNGGSHTLGEWELLKKQYGNKCVRCGRSESGIRLTEDHIIPISKGGSDNIQNIQPLCGPCNSKKNTKIIKYELVEVNQNQ